MQERRAQAARRDSKIASTRRSAWGNPSSLRRRHLAVRLRCRRRCRIRPRSSRQLPRAEHEPADGRLAAAEDEVVGAELGELDLRLLDREEVLHRLRERPVAVLEARLRAPAARPRSRRAPAGGGCRSAAPPTRRTSAGTYASMRASTRTGRATTRRCALQLGDRLVEQLDVELEADSGDVARLLGAEQLARAADLEVAHRDREARAELGVVGERREPCPRLGRELAARRDRRGTRARSRRSGRRGRGSGRAARARACRRARRSSVFACGMSMPDSMIVVETSTSASPRRNACIWSSSSRSRICPCATRKRSVGSRAGGASRPPRRSSRRGCAGRSLPPTLRARARARA